MGWFTRRKPPEPPEETRDARYGPEPALAPSAETPGVRLVPFGDGGAHAALAAHFTGPALADALAGRLLGTPVAGIAGLRVLHRDAGALLVRFGPPPGARWAFRHVRAVAVLSGKLTLVDGEEPRVVRGGSLALLARPGATLYVEAGNDSALAIAVADPGFVASLG